MQNIEIDFDVYKELTIRRKSENITYNDVIRELLGLSNIKEPSKSQPKDMWIVKGVRFPEGTDFRASYKGDIYNGKVDKNSLYINGKYYNTPSLAAVAITGYNVNGWRFWKVRLPNQSNWKTMDSFRTIR